MTTANRWGAYVTDYARAHRLTAADMVAVIGSDDDAPRPLLVRDRMIRTADGDYTDGFYPVPFLDTVRDHIRKLVPDRE